MSRARIQGRGQHAQVGGLVAVHAGAEGPSQPQRRRPGYRATDLNGSSGFRTLEQGAQVSVHLATLPADGQSGVLWGHLWTTEDPEASGVLPW